MQHSGTGTYSVQCPRVGYLWSEAVGQAPGRMGRKKKMQFGADQWEKSRRVTKRGHHIEILWNVLVQNHEAIGGEVV